MKGKRQEAESEDVEESVNLHEEYFYGFVGCIDESTSILTSYRSGGGKEKEAG